MDPGTTAAPSSARAGIGGRSGVPRRLVASLAITQTIGYGVLYYAFSALLGPMSRDLGITTATAAGALTTAVLVTGLMSVPVGRWLDARGGQALMTTGSLLGTAGVLGWSQVHTVAQLYGAFVVIGAASAMVLYEPAFAVVIAVTAPRSRTKALLGITFVAGFASSIFIPLTGHLVEAHGWRQTLLTLAGVLALITVPLHATAVRKTAPRHHLAARAHQTASQGRVLRDPGFWLLAAAFVLHSAALAVIAVHLVLYLTTLGHPPALAATLAGLLGLLSVTGRVVTTLSPRWLPMATIAAGILVIQGAAISLLPITGRHLAGAIACLVLFGLGFGVASIATPAILLDRYGSTGYATIAGTLATPVLIAKASAPLGGAILAESIGYRPLILAVAGACITAGVFLALPRRLQAPVPTAQRAVPDAADNSVAIEGRS
ncbi:MFS transporter [Kribbella qitaiheensis]|uniref:MFS transporter n=1 Tax=Kribbella qitaiheensis TaxID=1544730 RepID=A0A7G6X486_9ACTN|nr:MFS transporter [Kribbella qitaiheensis]QNE21051.1 MFS transporter [Kribbella qitaiheensis]